MEWKSTMRLRRIVVSLVSSMALLHCGSDGQDEPFHAPTDRDASPGADGKDASTSVSDASSDTPNDATSPAPQDASSDVAHLDDHPNMESDVSSIPSPGQGAEDLVGYWVYTKIIKDGTVTLEREKPLGNGQGLHKFAFAENGRAFYIYNAPTLSDFDHPGTFEVSEHLVSYHEIMKYSCAHPHPKDENSNALNPATTYSFFHKVGSDELWFSIELATGFNNTPFHKSKPASEPSTNQGMWMVFQRISEQDFYGKHMIRVCQGSPKCPCHPDCPSKDLLREPAPLPACTDTWPYS
jgi:hypothetical protein